MSLKNSALAGLVLISAAGCSQKVNSDGNLTLGQGNTTPLPSSGNGNGSNDGSSSGGGGGTTPTPGVTTTATPTPIGLGGFDLDPKKSPHGGVDSPNGIFWGLDVPKITYSTNGTNSGTVDVYYSKDQGTTWTLIPPPDRPLSGSFDWTIPNETIGMDQVGICKGRFKIVIKSTNPAQTVEVKPDNHEFCVDTVAPTLTNPVIYPKANPTFAGNPIVVAPTEAVYVDFTATDDVGLPPKPARLFCRVTNGSTTTDTEITSNTSQSALGNGNYRIVWNVPANTQCATTAIKIHDLAGRETTSPDLKGINVGGVLPPTGVQITLKSVEPVKGPDTTVDAPNGFYRQTDAPIVTWETVGSEVGTVALYLSKDRGTHYTVLNTGLPLNASQAVAFPVGTIGFDSDTSRKCLGRLKVVVTSTNPVATKESVYGTDICVDNQPPKFLNATLTDPANPKSTANPIVVKAGKTVFYQYRVSDDVGFGPKSVNLYCKLEDGTQKLVGPGLDSQNKTLGTIWVVPENTNCKSTILKVTDLAGKEATVELRGVRTPASPPVDGVNVTIDVNPKKGPASQPDAPIGLYDSKDKPKVSLTASGSNDGKIDLYYRIRPATDWVLIKADLPLTTVYDWTLPNQTIGLDAQGCRGQLMARIRSTDPATTKDVIYANGFCVDKDPPKVVSASIYPKADPNTSDSPLKVKGGDVVVIPYVFSDDVGISPTNRTDLYCKAGLLTGGMTKVSANLVETKNGNSGTLEWTVPSGTTCFLTVLKVTDLSGKSTQFMLKGLTADGTTPVDPPGSASCKTGLAFNDPDLLGYYCLNQDFKDASPKKNDLVKGNYSPTFQDKPINPVAIKPDFAFGKAAYFDGRSFAVAKQLSDFPIGDAPRTYMTWIYANNDSWLHPDENQLPLYSPNRQSMVFTTGVTQPKKAFGMELCCYEGCKCPSPNRPLTMINNFAWDSDFETSPTEVNAANAGIPKRGWWHYAITYSGTAGGKKLTLYLNGKKVSEKTVSGLETTLGDLQIGSGEPTWEPGEYGKFLNGRLSHFAFWKRSLTGDDVKKEYDGTKPTKCDDDAGDGSTDSCRGIKATLTYLSPALAVARNEQGFGRSFVDTNQATFASDAPDVKTVAKPQFFNDFAVGTRDSSTGYPDYQGKLLADVDGVKLEDYFMLTTVDTSYVMGDSPSGDYQFAILSDDDAILEFGDESGSAFKRIVSVDQGPPKLYCAGESVSLVKGKKYPIRVKYRQGQKSGIAMVMLWRKVSGSVADPVNCPAAAKYDDGTYFYKDGKMTDTFRNNLNGAGWKVVGPEHYSFVKKPGDACLK